MPLVVVPGVREDARRDRSDDDADAVGLRLALWLADVAAEAAMARSGEEVDR